MANPFLNSRKNIYLYVFVWALITGAHTKILYMFYHINFFLALTDGIAFNMLFAVLALGLWYPVRYMGLERQRNIYLLFNHFATALIFLGIWLAAGFFLQRLAGEGNHDYLSFLENSSPWRFINGILYYSIIILIYYLYIYYISFKENLVKESELKALVKETELSLLKSQLNPHFIFNSLNSISSLTITAPLKAQEMLIRLSTFLRYALEQNENKLIPFHKEFENAMLYLEIEKARFGNKLLVEKKIVEGSEELKIPNMILQPLLENAIKYGVCESVEPVTVFISCEKENGNFYRIKISNTYDSDSIPKKGQGIGIRNVRERLYLVYGQKDLLKIADENKLFSVNLYIPVSEN